MQIFLGNAMRALVIGGTGFIGSALTNCLLSRNCIVTTFSRGTPCGEVTGTARYAHIRGDVSDTGILASALLSADIVYYCATNVVPRTSALDPVNDIHSNLVPMVKVLELMNATGPKKLVYFSSGGTVYGEPEQLPVPESHPLRPICTYGVVKAAAEHYINVMSRDSSLQTCVLRVSNPFGLGQSGAGVQGVITAFAKKVLSGRCVNVWGDGSVVRDFIPVSLVANVAANLACEFQSGVFNVGSGKALSLNKIIDLIKDVYGDCFDVVHEGSFQYDVKRIYLDISKAADCLALPDSIRIEDEIKEYLFQLRGDSSALH